MATGELCRKYSRCASIDDIRTIIKSETSKDNIAELLTQQYSSFSRLWQETYDESNKFQGEVGLAPRHSKIGMVTGTVLHCLLALERSLAMRKASERSLKIVRVELSSTGERFVGVKFPADEAAFDSLRTTMATLKLARNGGAGNLFIDEVPKAIQENSISWISTPPTTMKSFFKTTNGNMRIITKRKLPSGNVTPIRKFPSSNNTPKLNGEHKKLKKISAAKPKEKNVDLNQYITVTLTASESSCLQTVNISSL